MSGTIQYVSILFVPDNIFPFETPLEIIHRQLVFSLSGQESGVTSEITLYFKKVEKVQNEEISLGNLNEKIS